MFWQSIKINKSPVNAQFECYVRFYCLWQSFQQPPFTLILFVFDIGWCS